ncbi:hypothetical protein GWN42_28150, partial [candidate division KSB1 bacterium]|nr:hypothetical protein [candidate division KSB1 bacterium]
VFFLPNPQHVRIRVLDSLGQVVENLVDETKSAGKHQIDFEKSKLLKGVFHVNFVSDSTMYLMRVTRGKTRGKLELPEENEERRLIVDRVLKELTNRGNVPIEERVDAAQLDSLVSSALDEHGIDTPFAYGILTPSTTDSVLMANRPELDGEIRDSEFRSRLFPNDVFSEPSLLALYFPEQTFYLFKQSALLIVTSLAFVLILVFSVAYLFRVLFKQKQFATRLTSFINNMTHEFKTPLSTISLASESLGNPAIVQDQEKFARYRRIIRDENSRMRQQVEQILQMAVLEEGDFELKKSAIDANEIISKVVQNIAPRVDQREGKITCSLCASAAIIQADSAHLSNVIHNLLDNALKYTRTKPDLKI